MPIVITTNDQQLNNGGLKVHNFNEQKLQKLEEEILRYRERLNNEGFRKSAKPHIQQQHLEKVI